MIHAGIDIGSRTIKFVVVDSGTIKYSNVIENSFDTLEVCRRILENNKYDSITATGYGRHLFAGHFKAEVISEIKAFSIGVKHLYPSAGTIIDIGGQDTKVISLDEAGRVKKFEMNDKCAAGTGRFLEIMSMALRFSLNEFGDAALCTNDKENISSMCTVFAESEVVSMLAKGYERNKIARGIHTSIVSRSVAMMKKLGIKEDVVFVGGVAKNKAIRKIMCEVMNVDVAVPENPQIVGALGCALYTALN